MSRLGGEHEHGPEHVGPQREQEWGSSRGTSIGRLGQENVQEEEQEHDTGGGVVLVPGSDATRPPAIGQHVRAVGWGGPKASEKIMFGFETSAHAVGTENTVGAVGTTTPRTLSVTPRGGGGGACKDQAFKWRAQACA